MTTRKSSVSPAVPPQQRLYRHGSTPLYKPTANSRRDSGIIMPREGSTSQARFRRASSIGGRGAAPVGTAVVADVTPTYSFEAAIRTIQPVNDRVAWTADFDGTLRIRSLPNGTTLKQLEGREDTFCTALTYVEQGQKMWAGFDDGCVRVYDVPSMTLEAEVKKHQGTVFAMLAMEGFVYTGGADWKIHKWDFTTGTLVHTFHGQKGGVKALTGYNGPTGAVLFSGGDDGVIFAWDPYHTGSEASDSAILHSFTGHDRSVAALETVPYVNQLWSGGEDTTVRVWDLATLDCVGVLTGHTAPVSTFMTVESRVWSADKHGHILLWDINTLTLLQDIATCTHAISLGMVSAMRKTQPCTAWRVWTAGTSGVVQCWNADTVPIVFDTQSGLPMTAPGSVPSRTSPARSSRQGGGAPAARVLVDDRADEEVASVYGELEDYSRSLEEQLADLRTQAEMAYERNRVEIQKELETQQLLAEENERLRAALADAGVSPEAVCQRSAPRQVLAAPRGASTDLPSSEPDADAEALQAQLADALRTIDKLQRELDAQQQQYQEQGVPLVSEKPSDAAQPSVAGALVLPTDGSVPSTSSSHERRFEGDNWSYLLTEKLHELRETFQSEASTALGVPASQLSNIHFAAGSLVAKLDVQHPINIPEDEVNRRLQAYHFSRLTALHEQAYTASKTALDQAETELLETAIELSELQDENMALRKELWNASTAAPPPSSTTAAGAAGSPTRTVTGTVVSASSVPASERESTIDEIKRLRAENRSISGEVAQLRDENDRLLKLLDNNSNNRVAQPGTPAAVNTTASDRHDMTAAPSGTANAPVSPRSSQRVDEDNEALQLELAAQRAAQEYLEEVAQQRKDAIHDLQDRLNAAQSDNATLKQENERLRAQVGEELTPVNDPGVGSSGPASVSQSIPVDATPPPSVPPSVPPRSPAARQDTTGSAAGEGEENQGEYERLHRYNADLEAELKAAKAELARLKEAQTAAGPEPPSSVRSGSTPWQASFHPIGNFSDDGLDSHLGDVQGEVQKLRDENAAQQAKITSLEKALEDQREKGEAPLDMSSAPSELTSFGPSVAALKAAQGTLQHKNYNLQKDNEVLQRANEDLQQEIENLHQQLRNAPKAKPPAAVDPLPAATSAAPRSLDGAAPPMSAEDEEDYAALQTYVSDGLKPLVARLKRRYAERDLDYTMLKAETDAKMAELADEVSALHAQLDALADDANPATAAAGATASPGVPVSAPLSAAALASPRAAPPSSTPRRGGAPPTVTTHHEKILDGDGWEMVVQDSPDELRRALTDDLAAAVGVPNKHVSNLEWSLGGLRVAFDVAHPQEVSEEEVQQAVDKARCDSTRDLYRKRQQRHRDIEKAAADQQKASEQQEKAAAKAAAQLEKAQTKNAELADKLKQLQAEMAQLKRAARAGPEAASVPTTPRAATTAPAASAAPRSLDGAAPPMSAEDAEDYAALQTYVSDGLKPLVARLKRRYAERDLDYTMLKAETDAKIAELEKAHRGAGAAPPMSAEDVEDYAALQTYVDKRLKRLAAALEQRCAERDVDCSTLTAEKGARASVISELQNRTATLQAQITRLERQLADAGLLPKLPFEIEGSGRERVFDSRDAAGDNGTSAAISAQATDDQVRSVDAEGDRAQFPLTAAGETLAASDPHTDLSEIPSSKQPHPVDSTAISQEAEDELNDGAQEESREELPESHLDHHTHGTEDAYREMEPRDSAATAMAHRGHFPSEAGVKWIEPTAPHPKEDEDTMANADDPRPIVDKHGSDADEINRESWVQLHDSTRLSARDSPDAHGGGRGVSEPDASRLLDDAALETIRQDPEALYAYLQNEVKPRLAQLQQQTVDKDQQLQETHNELDVLEAALQDLQEAFEDADAESRVREEKLTEAVEAVCAAMHQLDGPTARLLSESPGGRATVPTVLDDVQNDAGHDTHGAPRQHTASGLSAQAREPEKDTLASRDSDLVQRSAHDEVVAVASSPGAVPPIIEPLTGGASSAQGGTGTANRHGFDPNDLLERLRRAEALIDRLQRMLQVSTEELDTQVRANNEILGEIQDYSESCRNTLRTRQ